VAIAALAVGIGANTAIFSIVNGVLLEPLPYRDPDRLVTLFERIPGATIEKFGFSAPDFSTVRSVTRSFDGLAAYRNVSYELSGLDRSERVVAARVSPEIFQVLGVMPAIGQPFTVQDDDTDAKVAVISDALWRRAFARDPRIIGRTIALDRQPYVVVGVMPETFVFPLRGADRNGEPAAIYVPIAFTPFERRSFGNMYKQQHGGSPEAWRHAGTGARGSRRRGAGAGGAVSRQHTRRLRKAGLHDRTVRRGGRGPQPAAVGRADGCRRHGPAHLLCRHREPDADAFRRP
jgi:hypothetical protein